MSPERTPDGSVSEGVPPSAPAGDPGDAGARARLERLVRAVREGDEEMVEQMVLRLSRSRRWLAPLALAVGGVSMLFTGVKLLFSNWRLTLVQILPAMWIWLAMFDLKAHALHGKSVRVLHGPWLIAAVLVIAAITALSFFLNAVFAFAIVQPGRPEVRPALIQARSHISPVLKWGFGVGILLGLSTTVAARAGSPWFGVSLGVVIGLMMVCYVSVPSRVIGVRQVSSRRDKLAASAVGGAIGAIVCTPPYMLARAGILLLGSSKLVVLGVVLLTIGATLQAGATGAVKTVKMSSKLIAAGHPSAADAHADDAHPGSPAASGTREESRRVISGGEE